MKSFILFLCVTFTSFQLVAQPVISSFTPESGPVGTTVSISGTNFSSTPTDNIVYFGATRATVSSASTTTLTVVVPVGATYQPISVTANSLTGFSTKPFLVTFLGGIPLSGSSSGTQYLFEPKRDFTTDLHPNGIAIADFDGDGKPDVATANNYSTFGSPASVSLLRNTSSSSTISFASSNDISNGVMTYAVTAGDLNGDGKPELLSTSIADKTVSVFKNTSTVGTISFSAKIDFPTGVNPYSIAIGDFDRDGKPDFAVANYLSNSVSIYRNTSSSGTISFASKIDLSTALAPRAVVVADFDGDGKADLAVSNELSNSLSIFKNNSTSGVIAFASKVDFTTGGKPYGLAAGDINNDGLMDLVVANNSTDNFSVFRNSSSAGTLSFATKVDFSCGASPYSVAIGDLNGDGKVDITVPSFNLSVHQNNSSGNTITIGSAAYLWLSPNANTVSIADFDGDGKNDLAGSLFTSDKVSVLRNKNNEPTLLSFTPTSASEASEVTINGANLTGVTSVSFGGIPATSFTIVSESQIKAVVGTGASGNVSVSNPYGMQTQSGFTFLAPPSITSFSPAIAGTGTTVTITGSNFTGTTAVSFGNVPASAFTVVNNSKIEATVAAGATGEVSITAFGTTTKSGFTYIPPPTISSFTPVTGSIGTVVTITGTNLSSTTQVMFGGVPASSFSILSPTSIAATVADGGAGSISVTTIGGTATADAFAFAQPTITTFTPTSGPVGTIVTINGTNFRNSVAGNTVYFGSVKANVIASTNTALTVQVPSGATYLPIRVITNGSTASADKPFNLTFTNATSDFTANSFIWDSAFLSPEQPRGVMMSDIDGDGKSDIITTNYFSGTVSVIRNTTTNGLISFATPVPISGSYGTNASVYICVADITNDGKLDVIVSCNCGRVSVFKNTSSNAAISFAPKVDLTVNESQRITVADFDNDGKADIAVRDVEWNSNGNHASMITVFKNIGINGNVAFASPLKFPVTLTNSLNLSATDLDGDGKSDLIIGNNGLTILRNTSSNGAISFASQVDFNIGTSTFGLAIADLDGDEKSDIVSYNYYRANTYSIFRNTSTIGTISFTTPTHHDLEDNTGFVVIGNLDGDTKPDIAFVSSERKRVAVFKNKSTVGTITLGSKNEYSTQLAYNWMDELYIGDVDGDGRQDIAVTNGADNKVSILRNTIGDEKKTLCAGENTSFTSKLTGTSYQWQLNTGAGFANIADNSNYSGTNTSTLQLTGIPSSFNGYKFRCMVNGNSGFVSELSIALQPVISAGSATTICSGTSVQLTSSASSGNQWYLNGTAIPGATEQSYNATQAGAYTVVMTANGCTTTSADKTVTIFPVVVPTITISNSGCPSNAIVFTSTVTNPGNAGTIEWYINNAPAGYGSSFTLNNAANGTQVFANLISSANCATPQSVNSATLTLNCVFTAVADIDGVESFQLAPNPTKGLVLVKLKLTSPKKLSFEVKNVLGNKIYSSTLTNSSLQITKQIDLRNQPQGIYYLTISIGGNAVTEKIIVNR